MPSNEFADRLFRAAVQQLRADKVRIEGDQLIREALDAISNQESRVNLKDWEQSARIYLAERN